MFRAWKPLLDLKGTNSHVSIYKGRRCSQTVLARYGERSGGFGGVGKLYFSCVRGIWFGIVDLSRYEYVNRIVAKRRNKGEFWCEVGNCIVMGYRVFLMRYLSFRVVAR